MWRLRKVHEDVGFVYDAKNEDILGVWVSSLDIAQIGKPFKSKFSALLGLLSASGQGVSTNLYAALSLEAYRVEKNEKYDIGGYFLWLDENLLKEKTSKYRTPEEAIAQPPPVQLESMLADPSPTQREPSGKKSWWQFWRLLR